MGHIRAYETYNSENAHFGKDIFCQMENEKGIDRGKYNWCFVCRSGANYFSEELSLPICSKKCENIIKITEIVGNKATVAFEEVFYKAGDFRSEDCIKLLKQSDIVVTNPPFSLFREYIAQLLEYEKKFVIIGNQNAITYKEVFPLLKNNKIWLGMGFKGNVGFFKSAYEDIATASQHKDGYIRVSGVVWFTNLDIAKRHERLILYKRYSPDEYPKYDNYDAINVDKVSEIPGDYEGVVGVPITFLDKYNPDQFEIIKFRKGDDDKDLSIGGKCPYFRILIRHKQNKDLFIEFSSDDKERMVAEGEIVLGKD